MAKSKPAGKTKLTPARGRPPKLSNLPAHWQRACDLAQPIDPSYSMRPEEQEFAFSYALQLPPRPTIVELGVTHGKTAVLLTYAATALKGHYFGVDNFSFEGSASSVRSTLLRRRLDGTILAGNTADVPWDKPIDYLLIDAGHDRLNVQKDCHRWLPFVKPGGLVLFHDYNPGIFDQDPHYYIKYFADYYTKSWRQEAYIPYLTIRRKPDH